MTANLPDPLLKPSLDVETTESHPGKQGSVTFSQAESMAVKAFGDKSVESISKVLTAAGLSLR